MLEECYSMIELDIAFDPHLREDDDLDHEPDFEEISRMLLSVLDEVLSDVEEGPVSFH